MKNHITIDACPLRAFIADSCQKSPEESFSHKSLNAYVSWVTGDERHDTSEVTIKRIREERTWFSDELTCTLLRIGLLIDIAVIGNHGK